MPETSSKAAQREITIEAFGVPVRVSVDTAETMEAVKALLPPGWRPYEAKTVRKHFALVRDEGDRYEFLRDDVTSTRGLSLDLALALLEAQIRGYVALHAPDWIFVHAGVVAHRDRAIVLPGMSFAGKTTLVTSLVRAGAIYYSDEFAVLDEDGLVHPFPKPLSIRNAELRQVDHSIQSLGGTQGLGGLRIGLIVATSYRPGADWKPRKASAGEGVMALLANTVAAQHRPPEVMRALTRAAAGAVVLQSERGEADQLAPAILDFLDA